MEKHASSTSSFASAVRVSVLVVLAGASSACGGQATDDATSTTGGTGGMSTGGTASGGSTATGGFSGACTEVLSFDDPALERALVETIQSFLQVKDTVVYRDKAAQIDALSVEEPVAALGGIQCLPQLESLSAPGGTISDLTPLTELKKLRVLDLSDNAISDATPLSELTGLEVLKLTNNQLTSVEGIPTVEAECLDLQLSGNAISAEQVAPWCDAGHYVDFGTPAQWCNEPCVSPSG